MLKRIQKSNGEAEKPRHSKTDVRRRTTQPKNSNRRRDDTQGGRKTYPDPRKSTQITKVRGNPHLNTKMLKIA